MGVAVGERTMGLSRLEPGDAERVERLARRRIERADIFARTGPMLGLMGTLIPLGPGLAALGRGDVAVLAQAVTVAFDTTVLGLLVGVVGFVSVACAAAGTTRHSPASKRCRAKRATMADRFSSRFDTDSVPIR